MPIRRRGFEVPLERASHEMDLQIPQLGLQRGFVLEFRDEEAQIRQAVTGRAKNNDRNSEPGQVLLSGTVRIDATTSSLPSTV
ncbi:MAG: hypothetical protein ACRERU_05890 [Methylococcales bacterium]